MKSRTLTLILAITLSFTTFLPPLVAEDFDKDAVRNKVFAARNVGKYDEAFKVVNEAIKAHPEIDDLYYWKAMLYLDHEKHEDVIRELTIILDRSPEAANTLIRRAESYEALGQQKKAAADFARVIPIYEGRIPKMEDVKEKVSHYRDIGYFAMYNDNFAKVIEVYEHCLKLDKDQLTGKDYYWYGFALCETGRFDLAIPHLKTSVEMDQATLDPFWKLAYAQSEIDEHEDALTTRRTVFRMVSSAFNAEQLGIAHYNYGLTLDKLVGIEHAMLIVELWGGATYYLPGDERTITLLKNAEKNFSNRVQLEPKNALYWLVLSEATFNLGKEDEARKMLTRAYNLDKTHPMIRTLVGHEFMEQERYMEAISHYTAALESNRPAAVTIGDNKETQRTFRAATKEERLHIERAARSKRGECYYRLEKYAEAIKDYRAYLALPKERKEYHLESERRLSVLMRLSYNLLYHSETEGSNDEALKLATEMFEGGGKYDARKTLHLAECYAANGDKEAWTYLLLAKAINDQELWSGYDKTKATVSARIEEQARKYEKVIPGMPPGLLPE